MFHASVLAPQTLGFQHRCSTTPDPRLYELPPLACQLALEQTDRIREPSAVAVTTLFDLRPAQSHNLHPSIWAGAPRKLLTCSVAVDLLGRRLNPEVRLAERAGTLRRATEGRFTEPLPAPCRLVGLRGFEPPTFGPQFTRSQAADLRTCPKTLPDLRRMPPVSQRRFAWSRDISRPLRGLSERPYSKTAPKGPQAP